MKTLMLLLTVATLAPVKAGTEIRINKPVYDSAQAVQPLQKGDLVPNGTLETIEGKSVELRSLITVRPTVLIFYRGGWCPFCNVQMGQLVAVEPDLSKMGYQILAISPDKPENLRASIEKHKINYTLLSDRAMDLTRQFGLAYHVSTGTLERMSKKGIDLDTATGNSLHQLPVPAAFVLDTKGVIHFVYSNPDIKVRVNPDDLLKAAKEARN
jgi:peroxiredoxin